MNPPHLLLFTCATSTLENLNLRGAEDTGTESTPSQALRQIGMVTCTPVSVSFDSKYCRIYPNAPNSISTRKNSFYGGRSFSKAPLQPYPSPSSEKTNALTPNFALGKMCYCSVHTHQWEGRKLPHFHTHPVDLHVIVLFYFLRSSAI